MKVYTEVNYKWEDGKLIETSSASFEYSGDITLCGGGGGGGGNIITKAASRIREGVDDTVAIAKDPTGQMREGLGKGSLGQLGGKLYGGSFKQLGDAAQGKTDDDGDVDWLLDVEEKAMGTEAALEPATVALAVGLSD